MAKKAKTGSPVIAPEPPKPESIMPFDPAVTTAPRDVVKSNEVWSEYTLNDGTVVRTKAALLDVQLAKGKYNSQGEPIYFVKTGILIHTRVPKKLYRKPKRKS
jgi:hypothetical protein